LKYGLSEVSAIPLHQKEWEYINYGTKNDRDKNAAINILVAGGYASEELPFLCREAKRRQKTDVEASVRLLPK